MNKPAASEEISLETIYINEISNAAKVKFPEIERIILFGSRAIQTSKLGSDIDIAIDGDNVTRATKLNFFDWLNNESSIPYKIDVVDINSVTNTDLLTHIREKGIMIYEV